MLQGVRLRAEYRWPSRSPSNPAQGSCSATEGVGCTARDGDSRAAPVPAETLGTRLALQKTETSTFCVEAVVDGVSIGELLVDTGSGYIALNRRTFNRLKADKTPRFVRKLDAVMADGSEAEVPLYRFSQLELGGRCVIRDVEAAVLPHATRKILGMNALQKVSPFTIAVTSPELTLSNWVTSASTS